MEVWGGSRPGRLRVDGRGDAAGRELPPGEAAVAALSSGAGRRRCGIGRSGAPSNRGTPAAARQRVLALIRQKYSGDVGDAVRADAGGRAPGERRRPRRSITRRCGGGCWRRACGVGSAGGRRIASAASGRRISASSCSSMAAFIAWYEARGPAPLFDHDGGRRDESQRRPLQRRGNDLGRGGGAAALDRARTACRWRSTPTGRTSMCGRRRRRSGPPGVVPLTQFGRMCAALADPDHSGEFAAGQGARRAQSRHAPGSAGEETAAARRSPTMRPANAFLETTYWPEHNARFAQPPRPRPRTFIAVSVGPQLGSHLSPRGDADGGRRTGSCAITIARLQLERQSGHAPARSTVHGVRMARRTARHRVSRRGRCAGPRSPAAPRPPRHRRPRRVATHAPRRRAARATAARSSVAPTSYKAHAGRPNGADSGTRWRSNSRGHFYRVKDRGHF